MQFHIDAMTCGGCARSVTKTIQNVDPDAKVTIDLDTHSVQVESSASQEQLVSALREAGFPPR